MKQPIRLIALDLDGTLLRSDMSISDENAQAIKEAEKQGIRVMFATGRGMTTAGDHLKRLQLTGPQVTVNGSEVWENPNILHRRVLMPTETVVRLHRIAKKYDVWFWGYALDGVFNSEKTPSDFYTHAWMKFGFHTEDDQLRLRIQNEVQEIGPFEMTNSTPFNIEVNPAGINKASALKIVSELLGISMEQIAAMGDSLNDLAMLRSVGVGIAMGNAQQTIKDEAKWVTSTNEEHGVAKAIRLILRGEY